MRRESGFTLLEAIVAMAILAAGAMALFAALNGALRSLERAEAAARLDTATENAVDFLETVNPMQRPTGEAAFGEYTLRWRSEALLGPTDNLTDYLQPGLYEVALYLIDGELLLDGDVAGRFTLRRAGWRQVRRPELS
jgi:general secretion pathway protein I